MSPYRFPAWELLAAAALAADNPPGIIGGDPLARLGVKPAQLRETSARDSVRFVGKST